MAPCAGAPNAEVDGGAPNAEVAAPDAGAPNAEAVVPDAGCANAEVLEADCPKTDPPAGLPNPDWPNADCPKAEDVVEPEPNADEFAGPLPPPNAPNPEGFPNTDVEAGAPKADVPELPNADVEPGV